MPRQSRTPKRSRFVDRERSMRTSTPEGVIVMQLVEQAIVQHQQGHLEKAREIYAQVLEKDPKNYDALNLSGVIALQQNNLSAALALIEKAISIQPSQAFAYVNHGLTLEKLGRFEHAINSFDKAIEVKPDFAEAYNNKGIILKKLNRFEEAVLSYKNAISLKANYAIAYSNLGNVLRELKEHDEALIYFNKSIQANPNYAEAYSNQGVTLCEMGKYEEALKCHDKALSIIPHFAEAYTNRGITLEKLLRFEDALSSHNKAIELRPNYADAYSNRGIVFAAMMQFEAAIDSYKRALELEPRHAKTLSNLGVAYKEIFQFERSLECYEKAISVDPDYADAHWNKSLLLLLNADFLNGWNLYEWRWKKQEFSKYKRNYSNPLWNGEAVLFGKTILLYPEQGLGDTIQFCRYAKVVKTLGARVILEVPYQLMGLMQSLDGVDLLLEAGQPLPDFDFHCPLLSLPRCFKTDLNTIPKSTVYLFAESRKIDSWMERLGEKRFKRVGLVWSGNAEHSNDRNRSLSLSTLISFLPSDIEYVCLQKEIRERDKKFLTEVPVRHFEESIKDFTDTAALCELMDLVISVDTSVAHLAGAMGKTTFLLLPYLPDWRWLLDREDTPWYSSMHLYRQTEERRWNSVLQKVADSLLKFSKEN